MTAAIHPSQPDKKRHHFIPIAYLKHFTDNDEKLHVFIKDGDVIKVHHFTDALRAGNIL